MARKNRKKKTRKQKMGGGSMLSNPKKQGYAEGGEPALLAETIAYMKAQEMLLDSESTARDRAMARTTLDSLQSEEKGGTVDKNIYAQMMQEVDAQKKSTPNKAIKKAEGGSMLVPPEMEGAPVDTYPNIPPEEMAEVQASQLPDEEMESDYVDFVMNEALDQEEQSYLMTALEADPQLSMIFDKVVDTASEFSGSGPVDGPGDGVSDSIPARLSDGEFVMTRKATDQIGADNLQVMMDDAERAYDGGLMRKDKEDDYRGNINKTMLSANQMPSLNVRQR